VQGARDPTARGGRGEVDGSSVCGNTKDPVKRAAVDIMSRGVKSRGKTFHVRHARAV